MIDASTNMLYHIRNLNTESERVSQQMATGKNIDKGSENSVLHGSLISLEDKLRVTEGLQLQVVKSQAINEVADTNLADLKESLESIKIDLMKGLNAGMDRSDKLALATNLRGIRDNMYDLVNAKVDGEYIYAGSETTKQTLLKDDNYKLNGKVEFGGDGFLRKIAIQPGSYRDRGVTAYDVTFHNYNSYDRVDEMANPDDWDGVGRAGEQIVFSEGDRIIDENGHEWKPNDDNTKMQQYDHNGILIDPPEEIDLFLTEEKSIRVDLGIDGNNDASNDYIINIDGVTFTHTSAGAEDAATVHAALKLAIEAHANGYTVSALEELDKFTISKSSDIAAASVTTTDPKYKIKVSNEIEATGDVQARQATWKFTAPTSPEGRQFEAKHNFFDDLNIIINALEGYSTDLNGTAGNVLSDSAVRTTLADGLELTSKQFDASNVGHGELGGRNAIFNIGYEKLASQATHYNILLQEYGGADLAKLAMESKALELTYQSLYSTISKMNSLSLVNFLK